MTNLPIEQIVNNDTMLVFLINEVHLKCFICSVYNIFSDRCFSLLILKKLLQHARKPNSAFLFVMALWIISETKYFDFYTEHINEELAYEIGRIYFDEFPFEIAFLTITAPNGDYLYYEDFAFFLSTLSFQVSTFQVFPNPATDFISIKGENEAILPSSISIYDLNGRLLKKLAISNNTKISIENLSFSKEETISSSPLLTLLTCWSLKS